MHKALIEGAMRDDLVFVAMVASQRDASHEEVLHRALVQDIRKSKLAAGPKGYPPWLTTSYSQWVRKSGKWLAN